MRYLLPALLLYSFSVFADGNYKKLSDACKSCNVLEDIVVKHNTATNPDDRLDLAMKTADTIKKISLKNKSQLEKRREIYYAINASLSVLKDDFESVTVYQLHGLRKQSPKDFDHVFHRFPTFQQADIANRMKSYKENKILPNAQIPEVKQIED